MVDHRSGRVTRLDRGGLARKLRVVDLFAVGYGDLGSSIFYALGITTLFSLGLAPISLLLAGIVFACTSLTYAEMAAATKAAGGSASFARIAFNDLISFIAGWGLLLDFIVTIAISIFCALPYLSFSYAGAHSASIHMGFSIGLIGLLYMMNFFGVQHSTRISIFLTSFALIAQILILILALFSAPDLIRVFQEMRIGHDASWSPSWTEFWKGTAMAMVAYTGIESIAALGAETRRPIQSLPRAVMIVMCVLVCMYLGVSMIGLSIITPDQLGTVYINNPILGIVKNLKYGSNLLTPLVGLLGACLLFVAANAGLMGASRLAFNMGEYYQLPRFFYKTHKQYKTPIVSLAIFAALAAVVILWSRGALHFLADLYNFGAMLAFFFAHLSLIVLRIKQPHLERPFRAPLNIRINKEVSIPVTALIGCIATLLVWILVIVTKPEGRILGFAWMGLGIVMYVLYRRKKRLRPTTQVRVEKIKVPGFEPVVINNILVPTKGGAETETVQMACELAKLHGAKVRAIHLLTVPYSLPLDASMPYRERISESILQRAEAIAHEFGVEIETESLRAREIDETILQYLTMRDIDLLVLGAMKSRSDLSTGLSPTAERLLRKAPCRVFITLSCS